ncbi:MAG: histidine phosphatase family protein [Desulfovibrio sp.]|nr:histidine phosphatase family protein [Desulfovibrio sp.]
MIVLMRHAHTDGGSGRCIGRTEVPLSAQGVQQAVEASAVLRECGFLRLCTSPATRAIRTIEPLAAELGVQAEIVPELNEIDMGAWDGQTFDAIRTQYPAEYVRRGENFSDFKPPRGESFNDVADRAMPILNRLASGPQRVLAVTHAGVIRSVLCRITGHTMDDPFHYSPGYAQCTVFTAVNGGVELIQTTVDVSSLPSFLV